MKTKGIVNDDLSNSLARMAKVRKAVMKFDESMAEIFPESGEVKKKRRKYTKKVVEETLPEPTTKKKKKVKKDKKKKKAQVFEEDE